MYWEEDQPEHAATLPDEVVDLVFGMSCRAVPVDHAYALSEALRALLPWLADEQGAGMHTIHVPEAGNGWLRPESADELLQLSKRTKLMLRVPRHRIEDAGKLVGKTLDVAGNPLALIKMTIRPLTGIGTIFARHVAAGHGVRDESAFLNEAHERIQEMGIRPRKMLCGKERTIRTPDGVLATRSLMIADLGTEDSITLQQHGLGPLRYLGCGLFVPHKGIKEVKQELG